MLESSLEALHLVKEYPSNEENNKTRSLQRSRSYYQHAVMPPPRPLYSPPVNFGMVTHNLYRSSFPKKENFPYLLKLGVKSVLSVPLLFFGL